MSQMTAAHSDPIHSQSDHIRRAVSDRAKRPLTVKVMDWVRDRPEGGIAVMFVLVQLCCIIGALLFPESFRYLLPANLSVLLKSIAVPGIMALGVGVLMVAGNMTCRSGRSIRCCRSSAPIWPMPCWAISAWTRIAPLPPSRRWPWR
ncbi:hypothetical protein ACFSHQ_24860 [Gemmobacter lanyuensis]